MDFLPFYFFFLNMCTSQVHITKLKSPLGTSSFKGTGLLIGYFKTLSMPITFSSPTALPEVGLVCLFVCWGVCLFVCVCVCVSNESPYPPKFQLQSHYTYKDKAENVLISSILIMIFLRIFITALSPVSNTYVLPQVRKNKVTLK